MAVVSGALVQQGYSARSGDWTESDPGDQVQLTTNARTGLIYDFGLLGSRTLSAAGTIELGITLLTAAITTDAYLVDSASPDLFSASNSPSDVSLVATPLASGVAIFPDSNGTLTFGASAVAALASLLASDSWNGLVALVLAPVSGGPSVLDTISPSWALTLSADLSGATRWFPRRRDLGIDSEGVKRAFAWRQDPRR